MKLKFDINRFDLDDGDINWQLQDHGDTGGLINIFESSFENPTHARQVAELIASAFAREAELTDTIPGPCPFKHRPGCEQNTGEVKLKKNRDNRDDDEISSLSHYVWCCVCDARGPLSDTEAMAISAWNKRALLKGEETKP